MSVSAKIRQLHLEKERNFRILLLAELILLFIAICQLFGNNHVYRYGVDDMTVRYGEYSQENGGIYADELTQRTGTIVDFENIALPAGSYCVCLKYETDTDMSNSCSVSDVTLGNKRLITNGDLLYEGLNQTNFEMWLYGSTKQLIVHTFYNGKGSVTIKGLEIYETNALPRMCIFILLVLIVSVNFLYIVYRYDRSFCISVESKTAALGLIVTTVYASLPVLTDYLISTGDTSFHLWRIEGMKDALLTGQFPVRISSKWLYGYGYAAPVFYGETFLWPAALLRIIGFPIDTSYRWYIILVSAATTLISYICFKKILKSGYMGLFSSTLYTVSVYRIHKIYARGTLGEALAMMFLPFLVYGFYNLFTADINDKKYRLSYIPLVIGFSGLLQSHLLTGEIVGVFTILLCIIMIKKVFRKNTFFVLVKSVIYTLLVSAWFVVPFADYMLTGDFVIQHVSGRRIQERGIYPAHILRTFFYGGGNVLYADTGMYLSDSVGIGMVLVAAAVIWIVMSFFGHTGSMKKYFKTGNILTVFGILSIVLSLNIFPWDKIQNINSLAATLVSSIQFPDRWLLTANICFSLLAGMTGKYLLDKKVMWRIIYFVIILTLQLSGSMYMMNMMIYDTSFARIYNEEGMGFGYVSGGEYLPYGTDTSLLTFTAPEGEDITIDSYTRNGLSFDIKCSNMTDAEKILEVPLLYYKGYQAYDKASGGRLELYSGTNSTVTVKLPAGFDGELAVRFVPPWYWRVSELVTLLTIGAFIIKRIGSRGKLKHGYI
jgi:hypothetical protein